MMGNWLLFLPPAAVSEFELEPNMNADTGLQKTLWCGRVCNFRKIRWLQYCKARSYSLKLTAQRKAALEAHFKDAANAKVLVKTQAVLKGAYTRLRAKPTFLNELVGLSIRGLVAYGPEPHTVHRSQCIPRTVHPSDRCTLRVLQVRARQRRHGLGQPAAVPHLRERGLPRLCARPHVVGRVALQGAQAAAQLEGRHGLLEA